ncbi:MAG: amidase [Firmicutes bacterium]|nr:amidase [Bacillota bacterium]
MSPIDVVRAHLDAAESLGNQLNAMTTILRDSAHKAALAADERYRLRFWRSPLDGIPWTIKDLFHVAGTVTGCGSKAYPPVPQTEDAVVVHQLRDLGAILIGKTNLLEFALGLVHPAVGAARNPWNVDYTIGGSSSGSAAAVAAGIGLISVGTDTGGSVRNPAALGGVVGFKPSYGRLPVEGMVPLSPTLDHVGLLGPTVDDVAITFAGLTRAEKPLAHHRWRIATADPGHTTDSVRQVVDGLIGSLAPSASWDQPVAFDWSLANAVALTIIMAEASAVHTDGLRERWEGYGPGTRARLRAGEQITVADYLRARQIRRTLQQRWSEVTEDLDFVLLPTLPTAAAGPEGMPGGEALANATLYTSVFALLGVPALSVPAGLTSDGMPAGLQIIGRPGCDTEVLAFGRWVEEVRGLLPDPPHHITVAGHNRMVP